MTKLFFMGFPVLYMMCNFYYRLLH